VAANQITGRRAEMLVIAVIGLIANLITAHLLKEHYQHDLKVKKIVHYSQ
jgi:Co/Zn/Cd efflux system component